MKKHSEIAFSEFKESQRIRGIRGTNLEGEGSYIDSSEFFNVKNSLPSHVTLFKKEEIIATLESMPGWAILPAECMNALTHQSGNSFAYIKKLRELLYRTCQLHLVTRQILDKALMELDRYEDGYADQSRKRWTEEEDEALIERAACDDSTPIQLAQEFGRSPGAITSRISYLVGIKRVSSKVAGRFIGRIDGQEVEADIDGVLTKKDDAR